MINITIGVPVFNSEKTIEKTLHSLIEIPNISVHISDNNSTDSTPEICARFANLYSHIKYTKHDENYGAKYNFEYVLNNSQTDYFMWLGGDDQLLDIDLIKASKLLDDRNIIAVSFNSYFYYSGSLIRDRGNGPLTGNRLSRLCLLFTFPGANSRFYSLFRKNELITLLSKENYWGSDMAFSSRVAMRGKWAFWENGMLIRHLGASSKPLLARKNGGLKGFFVYIPIPFFIKDIFKIIGLSLSLVLWPLLLTYYIRLLISPVKHYISECSKKIKKL
jgi:glycosyltransferase involved in cell wall biosynthesis